MLRPRAPGLEVFEVVLGPVTGALPMLGGRTTTPDPGDTLLAALFSGQLIIIDYLDRVAWRPR